MTVANKMDSYAARLASFNTAHPTTRKRASNAQGAKTLKWPHKQPSPPQLARAGFFYRPTSTCPDNTTCYLCNSSLDGWEIDDNAVEEHLKHAPTCGWAIAASIEQSIEDGNQIVEDPTSEKLRSARQKTFGSAWPHESKRGWTCRIQKMVDAGWYYCPTLESDDFVKCSYCSLSLDGWEPKDNPYDEHQRRSPDCIFFTFSAAKPKTGRSKKSRNSSASRLSTQSNLTALDEGASIVGIPGANEDETMGVAVEPAKVAKADRGSKKVQKSKKAFGKLKAKGAKENLEETQTTSSFLEPEDDDFEVKVVPAPSSGADTKKRKSEEIETYIEEIPEPVVKDNAVEPRPLAKKRRVTRARSSVAQSQDASMLNFQEEIGLDAGMADTVEISPANDPAPKKKGKSSKKRATSIARKVSSASKASKASLRAAVPSNQDIEAALEADLDRPLTDNEDDAQDLEFKQPKHRRLTRTKPAIKKGTASIASTRRGTRASTATVDHVPEEAQYPSIPHSPESEFGKIDVCAEAPVEGLSKGNKANGKASRKVSKPQPHYESQTEDIEGTNALLVKPLNEEVMESKKPSLPKSRQVSRHLPTRRTRASNMPETQDVVDEAFDMNSSVLTTEMAQDDSSHETNTNAIKVGRAKRVNRQAPNAIKKARTGKKLNTASRNDDDIVRATAAKEDAVEIAWQANEDVSKKIDSLEYDSIVQEVQIEQEDVRQDTLKGTPKTSAPIAKPRKKKAQEQLSPATSNKSTETGDSPIIPLPSHMQRTLQPVLSPQSSDAENQPPSSRPSALRPPLSIRSSLNPNIIRVPLSVTTPSTSPSRGNTSKLQSTLPWTAVDLEQVFRGSPLPNKENNPLVFGKTSGTSGNILTSPEKMLTVEQWIQLNAERGEEKLRNECERLVGIFESQGMRALKTLEGIVASD